MADKVQLAYAPPNSDPAVAGARSRFARFGFPLLIAAAIVATYAPSLHNQFVRLDDHVTVYGNPRLIRLSWESISDFWLKPQLALYAPLTYTLYAVVSIFSRTHADAGHTPQYPFNPMPFHAVDLDLHILAALVVYAMLLRLIGRPIAATTGALIFGLHPVQVESVSWVTETSNLLCGLFSLLAVYLYVLSLPVSRGMGVSPMFVTKAHGRDARATERARRGWFLLATEVYLLALFSKPLGVIVPALAGVMYWLICWPEDDLRSTAVPAVFAAERHRRDACATGYETTSERIPSRWPIPWKLGWWVLMAAPFALIARSAQPVPGYLNTPLLARPFIAADAIAFYVYKILWPELLLADYDRSPKTIISYGWIYYTWIFTTILAFGVIWLWRRWRARPVLAGAIWFVVGLLPVLGLTPFVYQALSTVADRYLYLPMFGIALGVAWGLGNWESELAAIKQPRARIGLWIASLLTIAAILTALAIRTSRQTRYWHDSAALFDHTMKSIGREPGAQEVAPPPGAVPAKPSAKQRA